MAKYSAEESESNFQRAEAALMRAVELSPDQATAQTLYAQLEIDLGHATNAMARLLSRAERHKSNPDWYAGLCQACRYCGLLEESVAAHDRAHALDPMAPTSVVHSYFVMSQYQRVVEAVERQWGGYGYVGLIALARTGREADALIAARQMEETAPANFRVLIVAARTLIEGNIGASIAALDEAVQRFTDPEVSFYAARQLSHLGDTRRALESLARTIAGGYFGLWSGHTDDWFDSIRSESGFAELVTRAARGRAAAETAYRAARAPA